MPLCNHLCVRQLSGNIVYEGAPSLSGSTVYGGAPSRDMSGVLSIIANVMNSPEKELVFCMGKTLSADLSSFCETNDIVEIVVIRDTIMGLVEEFSQYLFLDTLPPHMQSVTGHKLFALSVVKNHGLALRFFSEEIRSDKEVVLAAIKNNSFSLKFASNDLLEDRDIILTAVGQHAASLRIIAPRLQNDKEIVMIAVNNSGETLEWASPALQGDYDVVKAAVQNHGWAMRFASPEMQSNEELFRITMQRIGYDALRYTSHALREKFTPQWCETNDLLQIFSTIEPQTMTR